MSRFATSVAFLAGYAGTVLIATLLYAMTREPPPVPPVEPVVVRMLDVTIRDSNTTNRRQRFECRPAQENR